MILSLLIPTIRKRRAMCRKLCDELQRQIDDHKWISQVIELIVSSEDDGEISIGTKRNALLKEATGKYVAFIDDDDWVAHNYIHKVYTGCLHGQDCLSLTGHITIDNGPPEIFEHSIKYKAWKTNEGVMFPAIKYERYPNHLNAIKREIALQATFPEIYHGEDREWSAQLHEKGLIKSEYFIGEVIYYYQYLSGK